MLINKKLFSFIFIICLVFSTVFVFAEDSVSIDDESFVIEETENISNEIVETEIIDNSISIDNETEIELLKSIDDSLKYIINTFQGFIILCFFVLLYKLIFKIFSSCIYF